MSEGMIALEAGCGMGHFTLEMARLVGPSGKVVAVDLQPKMISVLQRRARKAGLQQRIETRLAGVCSLNLGGLAGTVGFALAFAVLHEVPDEVSFLAEVHEALKAGGRLLISEPKMHVRESEFARTVQAAEQAGFDLIERPTIRWSRSAVFQRNR
jgi:ubiquinone/menaquinone biosynthesis C-methylase UbiE